jgi:NAD(P)H-flavin reductase
MQKIIIEVVNVTSEGQTFSRWVQDAELDSFTASPDVSDARAFIAGENELIESVLGALYQEMQSRDVDGEHILKVNLIAAAA